MTATVSQSIAGGGDGTTTQDVTLGSALTTGRLLVVIVQARSAITGVADTGLRIWTQQISFQISQGGQPFCKVYTAPVGTGGDSPVITATQTSGTWITVVAHELDAADVTTSPFSTTGTASFNNDTAPDLSTSGSSGANELGLGWLMVDSGGLTITAGSGFTELINRSASLQAHAESKGVNSAVFTADWTLSSSDVCGGVAVAVKSAPVASAAVTGTATASITEADIVAGSKTIIVTLTNDTFIH